METLPTPLRRRNSIATTTTASSLTSDIPFATSSFDFDLISSLKPSSYTSLRDIISSSPSNSCSSINLPSINGGCSQGDISIRNPLVKQAAWSYLQPTVLTSSEDSPGSRFLRRVWIQISYGFRFLRRLFDWVFGSLRVPLIVK